MRNQLPSCSEHEYSAWQVYPTSGTCHIQQMSHLALAVFLFACVTSAVQNRFPHGQARAVSVPAPACAFYPDTYSADGCAAQTFQTYGTNFRSHQRSVHWAEPVPLRTPLQQTLCRAVSVLCRASQQLLRFRPIPGNTVSPDVQPFPTGILPRASRICAHTRQTPAPLRQKPCRGSCVHSTAFPVQENISQACIWQIRSHAPQPVQTSPRLSFRRRTATSHPRAAFRARIPQNDFPAL